MRRKKQVYKENNEKNIDSFSYSGTIYIKLLKGKNVCFSKVFKNKGRWPLFQFFSLCLKGSYSEASSLQPKYINLFNIENDNNKIPDISDLTGLNLTTYFDPSHRVTLTSYPLNSTPNISGTLRDEGLTTPIGSSSITFKFLIPFTQLNLDSSDKSINALALYGNENLSQLSNPSAFFFIQSKENPTELGNLLSDIEDGINLNEYNLSIEWELVISNM